MLEETMSKTLKVPLYAGGPYCTRSQEAQEEEVVKWQQKKPTILKKPQADGLSEWKVKGEDKGKVTHPNVQRAQTEEDGKQRQQKELRAPQGAEDVNVMGFPSLVLLLLIILLLWVDGLWVYMLWWLMSVRIHTSNG